MSGQLDEISQAIGHLQSESEERRRAHERSHALLENISRRIEPLHTLPERVEKLEEVAQDYKRTKNKALGVVAGMSLGGTAIGQAIVNWFKGGGAS